LLTTFAGEERRFWYASLGNECFQVSVEPPKAAAVRVVVSTIETDDDADFQETWTVPAADLESALIAAHNQIETWARRPRTST
jgi:hypothetical protein